MIMKYLPILLLIFSSSLIDCRLPNIRLYFGDLEELYRNLMNRSNVCNDTITVQVSKLRDDCTYPKDYIEIDRDLVVTTNMSHKRRNSRRNSQKRPRSSYHLGTQTLQSCNEIRDYFQCRTIKENHCWRNETLTTFACCYGFAQENNSPGCPKRLNLLSMQETLSREGLGYFIVNQSTQAPIRPNITLLVPEKMAFKNYMNKSSALLNGMEDIYIAHMIQGIFQRSHMLQNQIFPTDSMTVPNIRITYYQKKNQVKWAANCVPMDQSDDVETTQGLIIKLKGILPLEPINETVYQYLARHPQYSIMLEKLNASGYGKKMKETDGHYTYLIPSNQNFQRLNGKYGLADSDDVCGTLTIKHHVLDQWICPNIYDTQTAIKAGDGTPILLSPVDATKSVLIEGIPIKGTKMTTNGHVIFVHDILISEKSVPLLKQLKNEPDASEFYNLIDRVQNDSSNLSYKFPAGPQRMVVLVPQNSAFQALEGETLSNLRDNLTYAKQFLENHVLPESEWDSFKKQRFSSNGGIHWKLAKVLRADRLNCIREYGAVKYYCGGKYVFIPEVLKPINKGLIQTLEELANPQISEFLDLLKGSNIQWDPNQQYTIWIPTNDKLSSLIRPYERNYTRVINGVSLTDIIGRHVMVGANQDYCCNAPGNDFALNPALSFPFNRDGSSLWTNKDRDLGGTVEAKIVKCDILARNWLIHIVDRPLMGSVIKLFPNSTYVHRSLFWTAD